VNALLYKRYITIALTLFCHETGPFLGLATGRDDHQSFIITEIEKTSRPLDYMSFDTPGFPKFGEIFIAAHQKFVY
jgi:hypothetical protein